jgi:hypothetical protein
MALSDTTLSQIEEDINKIVNEKMTKYIEYISKKHRMPIRLLLQDLRDFETGMFVEEDHENCQGAQCKGEKANGKRCTFAAKKDGYCKRHISQKKVVRPTVQINSSNTSVIPHNHSFSDCLTKLGCPACEKSLRTSSSKKSLIDI